MSPLEAYTTYVAVKQHFAPRSTYDFHKFGGKIKVTRENLDDRPDKWMFEKLARERDVLITCVANFSVNPNRWIGDFDPEDVVKWLKVTESLTYFTEREMSQLNTKCFNFVDGEHPQAMTACIRGDVSPQVLVGVNEVVNFLPSWKTRQWDPTVRGAVHLLTKLKGFVEVDKDKIRRVLETLFSNSKTSSVVGT